MLYSRASEEREGEGGANIPDILKSRENKEGHTQNNSQHIGYERQGYTTTKGCAKKYDTGDWWFGTLITL